MIIKQTILYGISKGALTYFTKGMAKELKDSEGCHQEWWLLILLQRHSSVTQDHEFRKIFNALADKPETV